MYGNQQQQMSIPQSPNPNPNHMQQEQLQPEDSLRGESESVGVEEDQYETCQDDEPYFDDGITIEVDSLDSAGYGVPADENQLTLSFRGQVYVFDSVTPHKVQAVLLLLGGNALSPGNPIAQSAEAALLSQQGVLEYGRPYHHPQREASLHRFRQKRKERCFEKKIRYDVRQEVAFRMQRKKGQFSSNKSDDNGQDSGLDDLQCTHCRVSSKSTPMMRRGPHGPRTLCNACGLYWASKGTLRELSQKQDLSQGGASPYRASDMLGEGESSQLIAQH